MISTEAEMIQASKTGDITSFEELTEKYQKKVYSLAYHLSGNQEKASKIALEALMKVYKSLADFSGESSFFSWIYRIVWSVYSQELKQTPKHIQEDELSAELNKVFYIPERYFTRHQIAGAAGSPKRK